VHDLICNAGIHPENIGRKKMNSSAHRQQPSWRRYMPWRIQFLVDSLLAGADVRSSIRFLLNSTLRVSLLVRLKYLISIYRASYRIECAHSQSEILECVVALLSFQGSQQAVFVEAGSYKGGSTAKFSMAAKLVGRKLVAFDSFEGLPANDEAHGLTILGEVPNFQAGKYRGGLDEVKENIRMYGSIDSCEFIKGWFDQTMPNFHRPVAAAYLDVDLVSSTRTCLRYLYPLIEPGGSIFSQDAHLPLIIELLRNEGFWRHEVGCVPPSIKGLGSRKLVQITKPYL
jgi:O-methyltransferase